MIAHPIHRDAALVLETLGGEASNFSARQLTAKIASEADLVLTMTATQREIVLEHAPRQLRRVFTLTEAARLVTEFNAQDVAELAALRPRLGARTAADVPDPIGREPEFFATVGSQIAALVPPVIDLCARSAHLPTGQAAPNQ